MNLALPEACKIDKPLCTKVSHYLERYSRDYGVTHASVTGALTHGADGVVPNQHGLPIQSNWEVSTQAYVQPSDYFLASGGVIAYSGRTQPAGRMLSARLQLGSARRRLSRPLVVPRDRQQHADEHRSADDTLRDALELGAADPARVPI